MRLIAVKRHDDSPGPPYDPKYRLTGLYGVLKPENGKRYFLAADPLVSRSWLSDAEAAEFRKGSDCDLSPRSNWIPVATLPTIPGGSGSSCPVIATNGVGQYIAECYVNDEGRVSWSDLTSGTTINNVTHWQPLPELP